MISDRNALSVLLKQIRKAEDFDAFVNFAFQLFEWLKFQAAYMRIEEINEKYTLVYVKKNSGKFITKRLLNSEAYAFVSEQIDSFNKGFCKNFKVDKVMSKAQNVDLSVFWNEKDVNEDLIVELDLLQPVITLKMEQLTLAQKVVKYEEMLANSMDVMMLIEKNELEYISPQAFRYLGYSKQEIQKMFLSREIFDKRDRKEIENKILEDAKAQKPFSKREYRIKLKDGQARWIEWLVKRVFDDQGALLRMIVNFRDVTEKIEAKEELEHQKVFLQEILDRLPIDIYIKDSEGKYIFINRSAADRLGKASGYILNKTDEEIFKESSPGISAELDKKVFKGEQIQEIISVKGENGFKEYLTSKQLVIIDQRNVLLSFSIDISEQRENERKLQESTEFINRSIQIIPDSIFIFDLKSFGYVFTNDKIFKRLGYTKSHIGKDLKTFIAKVIHPEDKDKYFKQLGEIRSGRKELYELEYRVLDVKGNARWLFSRKTPIKRDENGLVDQFVGLTFDITEQKEREEKLIQTREKLESALNSREEFLSIVSHEIRTPLNAIVGIANVLDQKETSDSDKEEMIKILRHSGENLLLMINDILDFSKIRAGEMQFDIISFDLIESINDIFMSFLPMAKDKGLEFECHFDDKLPKIVIGDPLRLNQIISNLLSNSIKFTEEGFVHLHTELKEEENNQYNIEIRISDSGIGVAKSKQKDIFDPFKQGSSRTSRKFGGTGLGLSITKELVEKQGGILKLESRKNEGTAFSVIMPFKKSKVKELKIANGLKKSKTFDKGKYRILYVEDVESNRYLMKVYCKKWNLDLVLAESGKEAIDLYQNNDFDLILMDLHMPDMDGFDTFKALKEYRKSLPPVIALSADVSKKIAAKIEKSGMVGYITKPIQADILYRKISEILKADKSGEENGKMNQNDSKKGIHHFLMDIYGDKDQYSNYIQQVIDEIDTCRKELESAVAKNDLYTFNEVRHKLKTTTSMFELFDLQDQLDALKFSLEYNRNSSDLNRNIKRLKNEFEESIESIKMAEKHARKHA